MPAEVEVFQYWIRNEQGTVWGPLSFATIEILVENKMMQGKLEVSADGEHFAEPGRFTDVRDAFPRELWGSTDPLPSSFPPRPNSRPASARPGSSGGGLPVVRPTVPGGPPAIGRPAASVVVGRPGAPAAATAVAPRNTVGNPVAPSTSSGPVTSIRPNQPSPAVPATPAATPAPNFASPAATRSAPPTAAPVPKPPTMPSASAVASSADGVPTSGDLSQLSPFQLYYLLASQAVNGKLSLTSGETTYDIWLKKGVPQQARSSSPGDSVLNTLGERGLLSAEQAVKAEAAAPQFGNDPIGAAFALGLIKDPNSVLAALTAHGQGLLQKALSLKEGTFAYDATAPQPGSPLPLGQKWPLLLAAGRALSGDEARRRLGDRMHMPVMKSTGRLALEDLGLNAQESRITASIEGVRSPAQLAENADPDLVARICYLLGELELASFAAVFVSGPAVEKPKAAPPVVGPAAAPPSASAAKPAAAAPGAGLRPPPTVNRPAASAPTASAPVAKPATVSASAAPKPATASAPRTTPAAAPAPTPAPVQDEKTLQALLEKQQNQDHFAVLGLKRDAAGPQIKIAYLNAVKVYHPDTAANAEPGVRELKEQIFARINEANNVLSDDASRANYLAELDAGGDEKVDVEAIFRAEEIFTKACIVVKARKYQEALKMLDEAIELNDNEAEFYAWRGWAAFMIVPDRKSALANGLTEMQKALKMSPRCAPAAFFAGQMLKLVGDNDNALVWFKKALDYDPQHLEAQSEIRALTRR